MNYNLSKCLPGFKMFNAFFADLKGAFEPTILTEKEKEVFRKNLALLNGESKDEFQTLREDLDLTAKVREARLYADGKTFVRYEFNRLKDSCIWSSPYQLMAVFDQPGVLESYTVLPGRGEVSNGITFAMLPQRHVVEGYETTKKTAVALAHLKDNADCEIAIQDMATGAWFAYIYERDGCYTVEWYLCCAPWLMTAHDLSFQQIEALVETVQQRGIKGFEDEIEWQQFNFYAVERKFGAYVAVDANLYRAMEQAKRRGDEMRVKTVLALGIGAGKVDKPYNTRVALGTLTAQRQNLFNEAVEEEDKAKAVKLFAMLAMRGHTQSRCNLGYHFHFGFGAPVDYDLAIYWYMLAAKAGDAYAMTNLGKIYSEKNSPKWDGPKAIKWFEKAAAKGETPAMGELGHCLLCGKCAGKDAARARSLLEKAVAANPDREDFANDLALAREESC